MIRKHFYGICVALICTLAASEAVQAQRNVGQWNLFPLFDGMSISNVVDTKDKVYYVSAKRLYSFDKQSNETYSYSTRNKLSDTDITQVYLNEDSNTLLVAYATGNIDLIDITDDSVTNLGDIAATSLASTKGINDVAFAGGKIYVATDFGLVIFDEKNHHVIESGMFGVKLTGVTVAHDNIFILDHANAGFRKAPVDGRHNTIDKFPPYGPGARGQQLITLGDDIVYVSQNGKEVVRHNLDWKYGYITRTDTLFTNTIQPLRLNADGGFTAVSKSSVAVFDKNGQKTIDLTLPAPIAGQIVGMYQGPKSIWAANIDGLGNYSIADDGSVTVLADKAKPEAITCNEVAYIVGSKNGERIYLSNLGDTRYKSIGHPNEIAVMQRTDVLIDGKPHDAAAFNVELVKNDLKALQTETNKRMFGGCQRIAVDPKNPDRYFIGNYIEGVFVIENNEVIAHFECANMPMYTFWGNPSQRGALAYDVNFDPEGNLWVGCWIIKANYNVYSPYVMLPRKYLDDDLSKVTKDCWQKSAHLGKDIGDKDLGSIFSSKSNYMFNWMGKDQAALCVTDTKGTYGDTSDDTYFELEGCTDQDGVAFKPTTWICAAEDKNGDIWFGTSSGVISIPNPQDVAKPNFTFTRIKVPRNDGTNYADYLLESEQVNAIAVDASNRKWIATENSGVYLVSPSGDKILENFTTSNSDLPSNSVYAVYCDPNSNVVYFGLASGLISYNSMSAPAADDFSDVYAYPNPVKPDFTGWITIKGLKDNSLVKIADAAGNVFFQGRSEGGMMVWDGCNAAGERVKSGVYYVFASQSDGDDKSGAVTKIMVIN